MRARNEKGQFINTLNILEKNCPQCHKIFYTKIKRIRFCSQSCSTIFRKPHLGHTKLKEISKCSNCGNDFIINRKSRIFCSHHCFAIYNNLNNNELHKKQSLARKGKTYKEIYKNNALNMINKRREQSKTKNNYFYAKNYHNSPNKIEKYLLNFLQKDFINWKFTGNGSNRIGNMKPDFLNELDHKVIELFGDYWHRNDDPQEKIDAYKKYGYDCLVIWEHEIYNELNAVLNKIKNF